MLNPKILLDLIMQKESDLYDRSVYAEQICNEIVKEHGTGGSSFIFGISGCWGEGKTTLLYIIEGKLENKGFRVIWFSPWKYAKTPESLLRQFIKILNKKTNAHVDLLDFDKDRSSIAISQPWLLFSFVIILSVIGFRLLVWDRIPNNVSSELNSLGGIAKLLIIPFLVTGLLLKLTSIQYSSKKVESVEQFEEKLDQILSKIKKGKKKIVVFVDDLDRISSIEAKRVLDALRTFFDKPQLTYIVTGDHTILEKIENITDPESSNDTDDTETGRSYLKKIFNVYWRIPYPTKTQLNKLIKSKLEPGLFSKDEEIVLTNWLLRFFEMNSRNIERFISAINFSLNSFQQRRVRMKDDPDVWQIDLVLSNKMLLIRALLIQEKAFRFFEKISLEPSVLRKLEVEADRGNWEAFRASLNDLRVRDRVINPKQMAFLQEFLPLTPRFFMEGGLKVTMQPFLSFASEAGLTDEAGLTLEDFDNFVRSGNIEKVESWHNDVSESDIPKFVERAERIINEEPELNNKKQIILNILNCIEKSKIWTEIFINGLIKKIIEICNQFDSQSRMEIYKKLFSLLGSLKDDHSNKFQLQNTDDFNQIQDKLGPIGSKIIANWLCSYMDQDFYQSLRYFQQIKQFLELAVFTKIFHEKIDILLNNFLQSSDEDRSNIFDFLEIVNQGITRWRNFINQTIGALDDVQRNRILGLIIQKIGGKRRWGNKRSSRWLKSGT